MILATVALPIWNSKDIAWLAMESLCRQRCEFKWELLVAEEEQNAFGLDRMMEYIPRLRKAGCIRFDYFPLEYKIALPQKWKFLAEKISKTSRAFLLQAADCYSEPLRLRRTMEKIDEGHDWVQNRRGYYYSFHYQMVMGFDQSTFGPGCKTGLNMAVAAELLPRLDNSFLERGIDNWFLKTTAPKNPCWIEEDIIGGIDTDDLNNISMSRRLQYHNPKPPFMPTDKTLEDLLPEDILIRMQKTPSRWNA